MYLHESLLVRTYIIIQQLKHILPRSHTHNHTSMLFDTAIIHYSSYRSSMNPQLNTWQTSKLQKCRGKAVAEYEPKYCVNKIFAARKYKHISTGGRVCVPQTLLHAQNVFDIVSVSQVQKCPLRTRISLNTHIFSHTSRLCGMHYAKEYHFGKNNFKSLSDISFQEKRFKNSEMVLSCIVHATQSICSFLK